MVYHKLNPEGIKCLKYATLLLYSDLRKLSLMPFTNFSICFFINIRNKNKNTTHY